MTALIALAVVFAFLMGWAFYELKKDQRKLKQWEDEAKKLEEAELQRQLKGIESGLKEVKEMEEWHDAGCPKNDEMEKREARSKAFMKKLLDGSF